MILAVGCGGSLQLLPLPRARPLPPLHSPLPCAVTWHELATDSATSCHTMINDGASACQPWHALLARTRHTTAPLAKTPASLLPADAVQPLAGAHEERPVGDSGGSDHF